jgi:hypothetical protein
VGTHSFARPSIASRPLPVLRAILVAVTLTLFGSSPLAAQQSGIALESDRQLLARLNELAHRKGFKNRPLGAIACKSLAVTPIGDCLVYAVPYVDPNHVHTHQFNTYDEPGTGEVRIMILTDRSERGSPVGAIYLLAPDARLIRAAHQSYVQGHFIWRPIANDRAMPGLNDELSYWRKQIAELETELDRVEADDNSCPQGEVRQIIGGPRPGTYRSDCLPLR